MSRDAASGYAAYTGLDGVTRIPFDPPECVRWRLDRREGWDPRSDDPPDADVCEVWLFKVEGESGRRWVECTRTYDPDTDSQYPFPLDDREVTEEYALGKLREIGADIPPGAGIRPVTCSQSDLAEFSGKCRNTPRFIETLKGEGRINYRKIRRGKYEIVLADPEEHRRLGEWIAVRRRSVEYRRIS